MRVDTLVWLIQHELKLWWRETERVMKFILVTLALVVTSLLVVQGFLLLSNGRSPSEFTISSTTIWTAVSAWAFACFYTFTQAIDLSMTVVSKRGELDLLMSSPLDGRVIYASRLLSVAIKLFLQCCWLVIPFSLFVLFLGIPRILGVYPALIGLTLSIASLAMLLCLGLVRFLGLRKAQTSVQVLRYGFLILFFLVLLQVNSLSSAMVANETTSLSWLWRLFVQGGLLDANSWLWFPARAIFFEPSSVLLTLLSSLGLSWLVVQTTHQFFLQGFQQAIPNIPQTQQFSNNKFYNTNLYYVLLMKEWRLMWRDRNFVLQILLLAFYFIVVILFTQQSEYFSSSGDFSFSTVLTPLAALISGILANRFIHFCISSEEAPDLLKTSPVKSSKFCIFKVLAALLPTWLLTVPIVIIVLLIASDTPWFNTLIIILGTTLCSTILGVWNASPTRANNSFKTRQAQQKNLVLSILELISLFAWAAFAFSISQHQLIWAYTSGIVILLLLSASYFRSRRIDIFS